MEIVEFLNKELKNKKYNLKILNRKMKLLTNIKPHNTRQASLITKQLQSTHSEIKNTLCVYKYLQKTIAMLELTELKIKYNAEAEKYAEISELLRRETRILTLHNE